MARRNHDKNGSTITPLIGNGVTAQKNLVNTGKGKALTPGGREKKIREKIAETTGKKTSLQVIATITYSNQNPNLEKGQEAAAGRWPVRNKCTGKNQIRIKRS